MYQEVLQEVEYYCANNNVALVMSFNGDQINPDKPTDIARMVTQPVVYHAKSIDITPIILQAIRTRHGWTDNQAHGESAAARSDSIAPSACGRGWARIARRGCTESIPLLSWMTGFSGWMGHATSER